MNEIDTILYHKPDKKLTIIVGPILVFKTEFRLESANYKIYTIDEDVEITNYEMPRRTRNIVV